MRELVALLAAAVVLAGCIGNSPEARFFVLKPLPPEGSPPPVAGEPLAVDAVELPDVLDRPELVRRVGAYRVEIRDADRWGAPLGPMIRDVLIEDLASRLPSGLLTDPSLPGNPRAGRALVLDLHDFAPGPDGRVLLDVSWKVLGSLEGTPVLGRRERIEVTSEGPDAGAQAAGMSRALAQLADRVVARLAEGSANRAGPDAAARER